MNNSKFHFTEKNGNIKIFKLTSSVNWIRNKLNVILSNRLFLEETMKYMKYTTLDIVIFDSEAIISRLNSTEDENLLCVIVHHYGRMKL